MYKKITLALLLAFALTPAFAQNALLYKISGKGLKHPGYLYGTIHLICPDDFSLSPQVKAAVAAAGAVYFEIDLDDFTLLGSLQKAMQPDPGYDLSASFRPGEFARLAMFMHDSLHADTANLRHQKLMAVQLQVLQHAIPCPTPLSYEIELLKIAMAGKKPVMGLEMPADQIAVFDAIPDSVESRMIMEYVNDFAKQRHTFAEMVANYKKQDLTALHRQFSEASEWAGYEDVLVYDRNRNWVPVITHALQQGPVFIACGAMHLGGEKGLLALLKAQGYEVTPMP